MLKLEAHNACLWFNHVYEVVTSELLGAETHSERSCLCSNMAEMTS